MHEVMLIFIREGEERSYHWTPYTPKAVVIDNHLPRQPLISSYVPDWPLPPRVYIIRSSVGKWDGAPAPIYARVYTRKTDTCRLR